MTFPLSIDAFFGGLKVRDVSLYPDQPVNVTRSEGGAVHTAGRGVPLWRGSASLVVGYHVNQAAVESLFDVAARPGASFLAYDKRLNGPRSDPGGAALGAAEPWLFGIAPDNLTITIAGLPVNYQLSPGDHVGFTFGANPTRYALLRLAVGGFADGEGRATVTASTFIPSGAAAGASVAVSLVRPVAKFVLDAAPTYGQGAPLITAGGTITFTQTLR